MPSVDTVPRADPSAPPRLRAAWYRALTLRERLALTSIPAHAPDDHDSRATDLGHSDATSALALAAGDDHVTQADRIEHALWSWKTQPPFDHVGQAGQAGLFDRRLALDGLSEHDLRTIIAESPDGLRRRMESTPAWMEALEAALERPVDSGRRDRLSDRRRRKPTIAFVAIAEPFIARALDDLTSGAVDVARRSPRRVFDPADVGQMFLPHLLESVLRLVSRTLVLELNVARVTGRLSGATPEDRFASFVAQLDTDAGRLAILEEYPVLARLLVERAQRWVTVSLETLQRLADDLAALERTLGVGQPLDRLAAVSSGLADPHDGGRSVAILRFASGAHIVYKPKPLAADARFQSLVRWMNAAGFEPVLHPLAILDRGSYGWVEHAAPTTCRSVAEATRFYERAGGLLALLHVTDATDLHAGNVMAAGEHPMLIDLEALFHPHRSPPLDPEHASVDEIARRRIRSSVVRIGLLPERQWGHSEQDGIDISGLGAPDGQTTPHAVAAWDDVGTDTMRLVRRHRPVSPDHNRPMLDGCPLDVLDYQAALQRGFRAAYRILADRREALLAPDGPLRAFADVSVSVFLRSSRTYRRLLRESYHPDVLRDALDRDRLFDRLWAEVPRDDALVQVIRTEGRDLWNADIPCFSSRPGSRTLWYGDGKTVEGFFPESSLAAVERLVAKLGDDDCAQQSWFIDASLATLPSALHRWPAGPAVRVRSPLSADRLLAAAESVGRRLDRLAVRHRGSATWIGLIEDRSWSVERAGLDLDSGIPGIVLFLGYLGAATGSRWATDLARAGVDAIRAVMADRDEPLGPGGFDGVGGLIYTLSHLAVLWNSTDLATEATTLAVRVPALLEPDTDTGIVNGSAGCALALRSLRGLASSDSLDGVAAACGLHLIEATTPPVKRGDANDGGRATSGRDRPGLAHGAAGVALALLELHSWTSDRRCLLAASRVLRRVERANGAAACDARACDVGEQAAHSPSAATAWCHGTDAHLWAQLLSAPATASVARGRAAAARLAEAIRGRGAGGHCLCHGDLGRLELLTRAAHALADEGLCREARTLAAMVLDDIEENGPRCGTPQAVETPGLLTGLAGIGYGLLRLARPGIVPAVLTLEPPRLSRRTDGHR